MSSNSESSVAPSKFKKIFDCCLTFYKKHKVIFSTAIFLLGLCLILYIPHYNDKGQYVLFGKHYTKNEVKYLHNHNILVNHVTDLEKQLANSKSRESSLMENLEKTLESKKKLDDDHELLQSKFTQQDNYIKENQTEKTKKKKDKKKQFSEVSKKIITNERPQMGNMFNKNIKQFVN